MRPMLIAAIVAAGPALADGAANVETLDACIGRLSAPEDHADWCKGVVAEPCLRRDEGRSTEAMVNCIGAETQAWDAIREREYDALWKGLDPRQREMLQQSHAAWREFVEADCAFPTEFERGELGLPWAADCRLNHTADRALALRGYRDYRGY